MKKASVAQQAEGTLLEEHGFWDYTTPRAGGMEGFRLDDYLLLLDDMAAAGMNSLMICVKWFTTGYRSRLSFLDQLPGNPMIESDNELLRQVIEQARARHIKVWVGAVVSIFAVEQYGLEPYVVYDETGGGAQAPVRIGVYDADSPEFTERAVQICEELVTLFPGAAGLEVELENCGKETPHRIPLYDRWAEENGRPRFDQLGHPLDPRSFNIAHWRDYTTAGRLRTLRAVESAVRSRGFRGELSTLCETGASVYTVCQEVNLEELRNQCPQWSCITYEFAKWHHRLTMMDFCIEQPKQAGLKVFYIPRGVMTWGSRWPLTLSLEENWARDIEDLCRFHPHGLWWFGCGTVNDGSHVSLSRLRTSGYADGVEARRALLRAVAPLRTR